MSNQTGMTYYGIKSGEPYSRVPRTNITLIYASCLSANIAGCYQNNKKQENNVQFFLLTGLSIPSWNNVVLSL